MSYFGESAGREAAFAAALLTQGVSSFGRNDDSLVWVVWVGEQATTVEIQVGKDWTAVDGRDPRDSSPFDFAQGQNDGKDL